MSHNNKEKSQKIEYPLSITLVLKNDEFNTDGLSSNTKRKEYNNKIYILEILPNEFVFEKYIRE